MKKNKPRPETRHYTKWELTNRWNRRGERTPAEGEMSGALLHLPEMSASALAGIRASRERLDSLHGRVLDLAPRLRDLCWAIDATEAENREKAVPVAPGPEPVAVTVRMPEITHSFPLTPRRLREWIAAA